MSKLEDRWQEAVQELAGEDLRGALTQMGLPGKLATLASKSGGLGENQNTSTAATDLAGDSALAEADPSSVGAALRALFEQRGGRAGAGVDQDLLAAAAQAAARRYLGAQISEPEAREIVTLLRNGDFFGDLEHSTGAIALAIPALARSIPSSLTGAPSLFERIFFGFFDDLTNLVQNHLPTLASDLADGTIDEPPRILDGTVRALYSEATIQATVKTVRMLIAPENRSLRLAILLYARFNGIPIEEEHLDTLHDHVLNTDEPNLGPALRDGVAVLKGRYPQADQLIGVLGRFSASRPV